MGESGINRIDQNAEPWSEDLVAEIHKREGALNLAELSSFDDVFTREKDRHVRINIRIY